MTAATDLTNRLFVGVAMLSCAVLLVCCSGPARRARSVDMPVARDIPMVLLGTIGAETSIGGLRPQLVSGYGLVVGLNGTGGGELPAAVRSTMERMLAQRGIGRGGHLERGPMAQKSPSQVLRDPNVAVVIVQAAIPTGMPPGQRFDVAVRALPGTGTTSLEGGLLWTTELRLGPPTPFEGVRTRQIAEARGPLFINPFEEPSAGGAGSPRRLVGRVLGGGDVVKPLRLDVQLDNTSHARARAIVAAINSRFPPGPGDDGPIASGRDDAGIAVTVPFRYRDDTEEFIQLLAHTEIDQSYPEERARRFVQAMKEQPTLSEEISWCLQAIGPAAIPFVVPLYDSGELAPRFGALTAGAKLGDTRTIPYLLELSEDAPTTVRAQAIGLLGRLPANPRINVGLRELLDVPELEIRVAAYEVLQERRDTHVRREMIGSDPTMPLFLLDQVMISTDDPLIYVTQQGEPRIALFGAPTLELDSDDVISAWGDRFLLTTNEGETSPRLWFEDHRTGKRTIQSVKPELGDLVRFISHKQTPESPEPGLGLSYAETVGLLYEIQRQGGFNASFATERDRLMAELLDATAGISLADRPESDESRTTDVWSETEGLTQPGQPSEDEVDAPIMIVPIERGKR